MKVETSTLTKRKGSDALLLPFFKGKKPAFPHKGFESLYMPPIKSGDFSGDLEQVVCHYPSQGQEKRVVLVGLGEEKELTCEKIRRSYALGASKVKSQAKKLSVCLPTCKNLSEVVVTIATAEGIFLTSYTFDANKSEKDKSPSVFDFIGADKKALEKARGICESVAYTRDLVFENADTITPTYLGETAKKLAVGSKVLKATVLGRKQIIAEKLHLIEAVSRSATEEPAVIVLDYRGDPNSKKCLALVGKGITYDTGGLSLKDTPNMLTMREDMAGAATVLGVVHAASKARLPLNIVAVISATENTIGPNSYKVGDVYTSHKGVTVEVTNTDAEGRLVLADALSYVQKKFAPAQIIDLATLTGGVLVALGEEAAGLMTHDDQLAESLMRAGDITYERVWRLPMYDEYRSILKSKVADIKNSGTRLASSIQGGIFLSEFVDRKTPWAHLDIAGMAFPSKQRPYQPIQASGYGVRLLIEYLENLKL